MDRTLRVSEVFLSIQGESLTTGLPFIFVRLGDCNLSCVWCDTTGKKAEEMSLSDILTKVESYAPVKQVLVTGGEPLVQENTSELLRLLVLQGFTVQLETNGSMDITPVPRPVVCVVDVKCPGSGCGDSFLERNLSEIDLRTDQLKFVLADRVDFDYMTGFLRKHNLSGPHILASPVSGSLDPETLAGWILADRLDIRMQLQLHKIIWGPDAVGV